MKSVRIILKLFILPLIVLIGWIVWYFGTSGLEVAKNIQVENDFSALSTQLGIYADQGGRIPTTEQGLEALVSHPTIPPYPKKWDQLLFNVFKDPWHREYQYRQIDEKTFELRSEGERADDPSDDMVHRGTYHTKSD
jgi:type II secretion system protein G